MRLFHSATIFCCYICTCICCLKLYQADYQVGEGFFTSILVGGRTQLQCIYYLCRIQISRPPRVFRRFKRRSCYFWSTQCISWINYILSLANTKGMTKILKYPLPIFVRVVELNICPCCINYSHVMLYSWLIVAGASSLFSTYPVFGSALK